MVKKSLVLGMLGASFLLSACSSNHDVPQAGTPAKRVSDIYLAKQQTAENEVHASGLEYLPEYQAFSAGNNLISPCKANFQSSLLTAGEGLVRIKAALDNASEMASFNGREGYQQKALEFYDKVDHQVSSLGQISSSTSAFCQMDQAKVEKCLGSSEQVRVLIDPANTRLMPVHPLMIPKSTSAIAIYSIDSQADSIRAVELVNGSQAEDFSSFMNSTSLSEIRTITQCLETSGLKSELGLQLLDTAHLASVESGIECQDAKPEILFCAAD